MSDSPLDQALAGLPGWHVMIWMPEAPDAEAEALMTAIADLTVEWPATGWDAHVSAVCIRGAVQSGD